MFFLFNKCPCVIAHMPLNNATEHLVSLRHIVWLFSTQVYFYELSGNIMERMLHQDRYTDTEIRRQRDRACCIMVETDIVSFSWKQCNLPEANYIASMKK